MATAVTTGSSPQNRIVCGTRTDVECLESSRATLVLSVRDPEESLAMRIMKQAEANAIFQDAVDTVVREKGEVGLQVAAYLDGQLIIDVQSGIADLETGRRVDRETLFPVFSASD